MQILNQAAIDAFKTTLLAKFNEGLALSTEEWKIVAGFVKSNSASNTYAWLSRFPAFREWVGARQHKKVAETVFVISNKKYETTIDVQRTDFEDDTLGHYATVALSAGQAATDHKNDLIFSAFKDGFSQNCYDGQFFFDTDHPVYAEADGSGAATSVSNLQIGTNAPWILLCTKRAPKPMYLQERMAAHFDSQTTDASEGVFERDVYSFGGRYRGTAAFGFWQCAFASKAPLTAENFNAAYAAMMKFKGDGGQQLGIRPDLLVCGADLRAAANKLLLAEHLANGESNTNYKAVDLFVTNYL